MRTATLETSKKLQELGIEIKTTSDWYDTRFGETASVRNYDEAPWICPAPTFDEIWALIPPTINGACQNKILVSHCVGYADDFEMYKNFVYTDNIAESAALLLIWCKENNHL